MFGLLHIEHHVDHRVDRSGRDSLEIIVHPKLDLESAGRGIPSLILQQIPATSIQVCRAVKKIEN